MTTKEKARDKRLQKLYGVTLANYNEELKKQGGVCKICLRPPVTVSLSVDHDHAWKKVKIIPSPAAPSGIYVVARYNRKNYHAQGSTSRAAKKHMRQVLLRASVRGLLCASCNRGLQRFRDNPDNLLRAAEYLRKHQQPTEG
jgi:hypothetical protein